MCTGRGVGVRANLRDMGKNSLASELLRANHDSRDLIVRAQWGADVIT